MLKKVTLTLMTLTCLAQPVAAGSSHAHTPELVYSNSVILCAGAAALYGGIKLANLVEQYRYQKRVQEDPEYAARYQAKRAQALEYNKPMSCPSPGLIVEQDERYIDEVEATAFVVAFTLGLNILINKLIGAPGF